MSRQLKPIRFSAGGLSALTSSEAIRDFARRSESLGYSAIHYNDHLPGPFSPLMALLHAADATSRIRLATHVVNNDLRHPAILAKDVATLDRLSDGRVELGIGAGTAKVEYEEIGIPYDKPLIRIARLEESIHILKGLFAGDPFSFHGTYYNIENYHASTYPVQKPHPPINVGGGSANILRLAGREADIISMAIRTTPAGQIEFNDVLPERLRPKLQWIREGAGARYEEIELSTTVRITITNDVHAAARSAFEAYRRDQRQPGYPRYDIPPDFDVDALLESPAFAFGTVKQVAAHLSELREEFGISNFTVSPDRLEDLAPVIEELGGA